MMVWYLAHPVASDERYTREQNLAHAKKVLMTFLKAEIPVVCPWLSVCDVLEESEQNVNFGLAVDGEVVRRLKNVILTGHKLSSGMKFELQVAKASGGVVVDLIGVSCRDIVGKFFEQCGELTKEGSRS